MVAISRFQRANKPHYEYDNIIFFFFRYKFQQKILPNEFSNSIYEIKLHPQLLFFVTITRRISYSYQFFDTNFKNVQFLRLSWDHTLVSRKKTPFFGVSMILFWSQTLIFGQKWLKMGYHKYPLGPSSWR